MFDNIKRYERTDEGMYIKFNLLKAVDGSSEGFPNVEITLNGDDRLIEGVLDLLRDGCDDIVSALKK